MFLTGTSITKSLTATKDKGNHHIASFTVCKELECCLYVIVRAHRHCGKSQGQKSNVERESIPVKLVLQLLVYSPGGVGHHCLAGMITSLSCKSVEL